MALEWFDGFDQYGPTVARLLDGVYAEYEGVTISTVNPRTGTYHLRVNALANNAGMRRVLTAPRSSFGVGYAFSIANLPTDNSSFSLLQARNGGNTPIFTVIVTNTGGLIIKNGGRDGATIAQYVNPVVFANSYQHFELRFNNGFKLWMNEVLLIDSIDLPTSISGGNVCSSVKIGNGGFPLTGAAFNWDIDDLYCYNMVGTDNIGPIGDCKVYTRFPNADTAAEDFTPSIGSDSFQMVNNVPAQDGTEFLSSSGLSLPDRSEFTLPDLPLEIVEVKGVLLSTRMFKTDAGAAIVISGVGSGAAEEVSPEHALGQAPVWFTDVFDRDPDADAEWTLSTANDMTVFVERTT